jgi:hypothetical protein
MVNHGLSLYLTITVLVGIHSLLVNIISKPTRITAHSNTLLDPIIISDTMNYIYSDVLKIPSEISDRTISVTQKEGLTSSSHFYPDSFVSVVF